MTTQDGERNTDASMVLALKLELYTKCLGAVRHQSQLPGSQRRMQVAAAHKAHLLQDPPPPSSHHAQLSPDPLILFGNPQALSAGARSALTEPAMTPLDPEPRAPLRFHILPVYHPGQDFSWNKWLSNGAMSGFGK